MNKVQQPRVLIDGIVFENNTQLGIWRFFYETISRSSADIAYTLLLANDPLQSIPEGIQVFRWQRPPLIASRRKIARNIKSWPYAKYLNFKYADAIWHSTFYSRDPRRRCKSIVTVYDMIAERLYTIGPFLEQRHIKSHAIRSADRALAISDTTAQDLRLFYPETAAIIKVMLPGADHLLGGSLEHSRTIDSKCVAGTDSNFCLIVGGRYSYKNFPMVVQALASPHWPASTQLVVVGEPFDEAEHAFIRAIGVASRITHAGKASNADLSVLYQRSRCLLVPSILEGFGIPILEAQSLDTVPVVSDTPIFREVAGDGAIYFDPHSPHSVAEAVNEAVNGDRRESLLHAGRQNVRKYSWDHATSILVDCYRSLWTGR